jgi:DNA-binding CsgD family transcriptional regulator
MDLDKFLVDLLDALYRSAVEPAIWEQTLDALLPVLRSQHAFLYTPRTAELTVPLLVTVGIDVEDRDRYLTIEADRAWAPINARIVSGVAAGIQDVIRPDEFERSVFYNEIVRPTKCFYSGFVRESRPDLSFHLVLCRPEKFGVFDAGETSLLQRLLPHLTTALSIRQRLHIDEQRSGGFEALIDRMDQAAVLVDARCRPVFINRHASRLLASRKGLSLTNGQLQGANAALTAQLHHLIVRASHGDRASMERMSLPQKAPSLPLLLDIIPVWRLGLSETGVQTPRVAIIFREPGASFAVDRAALQEVLKLTPRESEITELLANGAAVEAIAAQLVLTPGTVRYNLQRIFDKAGVHSQGALVALVRSFGHPAENDTIA